MADDKKRCSWCLKDDLYMDYHDHEWGYPVYDDQPLFEKLILDGFQAGLSWYTILKKRPHFQASFDQFDPQKIARWDEHKVQELLQNPGIVRNRAKIRGTIVNAQLYLDIMEQEGSFSRYLWAFVNHQPIINQYTSLDQVPATSPESDAMSKALRKRGFKFTGSTICYAFMQAVGMVDDHLVDCWRRTT
ncbi:MAG: DNA-3-methyladenine glycosylase I [Bacteroidota bacterium]